MMKETLKFLRREPHETWTMPKGGGDRALAADQKIKQITGIENIYSGGGVMLMIGIDVAEKLIALASMSQINTLICDKPLSQINCVICDKPFQPKRRDARCCSPRCRKTHSRRSSTAKAIS